MTKTIITNISIEIFSSVLCLVFLICILVGDNLKIRLNRVFIWVLLSNIAVMMSDALAFYSIGKTEPKFYVLNFIGNFCTFIFSYVIIMCFSNYINTYLAIKLQIKRTSVYLVYGVCGLAIALTFLSLLNNMYFTIDENNIYHRQNLYWLSQVLGIIGLILNSSVIIKNRKYLNRLETLGLAAYIVLPVVAVVIQMLVYGFVSVYIASTITITIIYVGMQAQYSKMLKEKELQLVQSRVAIMLSQIQPHFLYNTLVGIKELCDTEPQRASKAIEHFSFFLRSNLDSLTENPLISFNKELSHVQDYLYLEKMRIEDRLNVEWDIRFRDFMLPPLTLQPIVENAVRHGISMKEEGGTIHIKSERADDSVRIIVLDDGIGFDESRAVDEERTHLGIDNVRMRINAQCRGEVQITSKKGVGTEVKIILPMKGLSK